MIYDEIRDLANEYTRQLKFQISSRTEEMSHDTKVHYLLYSVLGISKDEGEKIDIYQNVGRFLYKYAGTFLEKATILCFEKRYDTCKSKYRLPNTIGKKPKMFEVDCLVDDLAHEIKWRDATTDGDHITKEHTRIQVIHDAGFKPIRIMFYDPERSQAMRVQDTLRTLYTGVGGKYYSGNAAWKYVYESTGIDLLDILTRLSREREGK
jgi:type II restriction enzyme